jgi:hypothetical protein
MLQTGHVVKTDVQQVSDAMAQLAVFLGRLCCQSIGKKREIFYLVS